MMLKLSICVLVFCVFLPDSLCEGTETNLKVKYLDAGNIIDFEPLTLRRGFFENDLRTYCYRGNPKTLGRFFETIELQLDIEGDDYTQYEGLTPEEVKEHHDEQRSLFSFNLFSQKKTRLQLSPFEQQCIGIQTVQPYRVRLQQVRVDFWRVIQLIVGLVLFLTADKLSHNAVFYYITGIALGICSSFMLLIWLASKLFPRRPMMYGVLIGGWTLGIYVLQMLWENLQLIVLTYRIYVFWYILVTGLLSFFFCYRLGPPKNKRSKNIIKWVLQLMALALIYFSSRFEEASAAVIILSFIYHYFPRSVFYKIRGFYLRRFPPKRRLLTNEEYYEQGVRETTKALEELRSFASSPDCKQWKVMSKLKDPMRFAAFVEGASHLRDEEILSFESSHQDYDEESEQSAEEEEEKFEKRNDQYIHRRRILNHSARYHAVDREEEISEDEGNDDDVVEVDRSRYSVRNTPTLNTSRRLTNIDNATSPLSPRNQRTPSRASRMVSTAQARRTPRNSSVRTFEIQESGGDSEG